MKTNNVTFGTSFHIDASKGKKIASQSSDFVNGAAMAAKAMKKNGINDQLFVEINAFNKKDIVSLTYINMDRNIVKDGISVKLSTLSEKTAKQVKNFFLKSLKKYQPADLKAKAVYDAKQTAPKPTTAKELIEEFGFKTQS
ncbi:MAG: hypothetical protein PHE78_05105 [Candidatus Gastranaerophilales bacterium]|nr:hypothetical protein [Candidatus Gastranaerophilales bacterium]